MDKAAKLIETAEAHLDADESARLSHTNGLELLVALKAAAKHRERMEKALKPFVAYIDKVDAVSPDIRWPDNVAITLNENRDPRDIAPTLGDFRAARQALSEEGQ